MRICDATQFYSEVSGGVRRYLHEKRRYILSHTEDEHILLVPGARSEVVKEGRLTTCTVASPPINRTSRYRVMLNLPEAKRMLWQLKPDIIESGDPYQLGWKMIEVGRELDIPVVGFYHSHFPEAYLRTVFKYCGPWLRDVGLAYAEDYIHRLYNSFDATLVPSVFLGRVLSSWGVGNVRPVHLGVDVDIFNPLQRQERGAALRQRLGIAADKELLLYVGRLAGEKNTAVLMRCFMALEKRHPGRFAFLVIGDGALRSLVAEASGQCDDFHWVPFCNESAELADYYRAADLFVHPGVCETFGLVALESQACDCPVVGIHGSYMDANIMDGLEHWAGRNEPAALADAIERILAADPQAIGRRAGEIVRERYAWPEVFSAITEIYCECAQTRRQMHSAPEAVRDGRFA